MKKVFFILVVIISFQLQTLKAQKYMLYEVSNKSDVGFGKQDTTNFYLNFVCTGPLSDTTGNPVGGYVDNKSQIQPWISPKLGGGNFAIRNAIFGLTTENQMVLIPYDQWNNSIRLKWGFQNGPMLVKDGINVCGSSTSEYYRAGIGFRDDGSLVVIISKVKITFKEFAKLFVYNKCSNAIYLDGYPDLDHYVGYCFGAGNTNQKLGLGVKKATKLQFFHQGNVSE